MDKFDYRKNLKELYLPPSRNPVLVDVPAMDFLMIDGEGDPNTSQPFQDAIEALYGTSYTVKFMLKKEERGAEYAVGPLEGLWYADEIRSFLEGDKSKWRWTLCMMQPGWVSEADVLEGAGRVREKKGGAAPGVAAALDHMRFESFEEGRSAQVMHIGPFADEGPAVERLMAFIEESGCAPRGRHHEIYLSDFRRADPARLKTVLRHPVECGGDAGQEPELPRLP